MKKSYIYMVGEVVPRLLNFLILPIMTRYLSPADYGVIAYVDAIILFVFIFSLMNLNSYLLREYFEMTTVTAKKKLIGNLFIFLVIYNVVLLLALFLLVNIVFGLSEMKFNILPILSIALICNFVDIFCIFPQLIYRVQERAISFVCFAASKTFFTLLAVVLFLEFYSETHGPISKYYGILLVALIYGIISCWIVRKHASFSFDLSQIKAGFSFSLPLVIASLSFAIIEMSDRLILEKYVSMADIGIYSIACALGFGLNVIVKGGYKAFEPVIFKSAKSANFLQIFCSTKKEYLFLIFGASLIAISYSHEITFFILPDEYIQVGSLMPIIVLAAFLKGIYTINVMLIMIAKDTKLISRIVFLGAALNVGINLLFIEQFGLVVAALSTVAAFFTMAIAANFKAFDYYRFNIFSELKDYLIVVFLSLLVFVQFNFNFPVSALSIAAKFFILGTIFYIIFRTNALNKT